MDALKRAEQEKREAAKRLEEARERTQHEPGPDVPPVDPDITAELETTPAPSIPPPPAPPAELSLEPRTSITGPMERPSRNTDPSLQIEPLPSGDTARVEPGLSPPAEAKTRTPLEFIEEIGPEGMASFDQTFHGVALPGAPIGGLFDETLPGSAAEVAEQRSYDQTLPGVPAAQLARDIGTADQPTPAAAQTVFTAGHVRQPDRLYKWGLPAAGLALLLAASVYYYYSTTPVAPNTPSPWVARGIEAIPPPADIDLPTAADAVPGALPGEATPAPVVTESGTIAATEPAPAPEAAPAPEPAPTEVAVAEPASAPPPATESTAAPAPVIAAGTTPAVAAEPAPPTSPSPIRISRSKAASEHDRMVREAYSYYQSGDYESASIHYLAALNERPDTLDALLGMGAIGLKTGDMRRAIEYFTRVLKLEPKNQMATAALIGLQRSADPTASESALKVLLQENPESPFLYFVLGNVYAAQSRWAEAQQAFFDAYRNDSANPDYALNLAATLDRLGQSQPALDYYGVALKLAEGQPSGFDPAKIRARMQTLAASGGQPQ